MIFAGAREAFIDLIACWAFENLGEEDVKEIEVYSSYTCIAAKDHRHIYFCSSQQIDESFFKIIFHLFIFIRSFCKYIKQQMGSGLLRQLCFIQTCLYCTDSDGIC